MACRFFDYSRSGYYKSLQEKVEKKDQEKTVLTLVRQTRREQPRTGGRKLFRMLQGDLALIKGSMGRDKFFDVLRDNGLLVKRRKRYERTTNSFHRFRKYKNQYKHRLPTAPNQAQVSDITYLRTGGRFVYLFLITDAYSRKIVGWDVNASLGVEGAMKAARMAIRQCPNTKDVIHHSDRGLQYCLPVYEKLLLDQGMIISMTEENHCYENAMAERVNGILKDEYLLCEDQLDLKTATRAVKEAIEIYNNKRLHWSLDLKTPESVHTGGPEIIFNDDLRPSRKHRPTDDESVHFF